jgi:hypothetical protein
MHVFDSLDNLSSDNGGGFLFKFALHSQHVEEMSVSSQFHEEVDPVVIIEKVKELDDVGVLAKGLNLDLVDYLCHHFLSVLCRSFPDS